MLRPLLKNLVLMYVINIDVILLTGRTIINDMKSTCWMREKE